MPLKDLTGQRFGMLTAIYPHSVGRNGLTLWMCRCECGGQRLVPLCNIRRIISCGCRYHPLKRVDITGQRFERLKAIRRMDQPNNLWECLCDCGKKSSLACIAYDLPQEDVANCYHPL